MQNFNLPEKEIPEERRKEARFYGLGSIYKEVSDISGLKMVLMLSFILRKQSFQSPAGNICIQADEFYQPDFQRYPFGKPPSSPER